MRLGCNCDYDKLQNLAEERRSLRRIMGIGTWDDHDPMPWDWRRIRDNLCLVHPETLAKINERVVRVGHRLEPTAAEKVRGDTFVVKTNIHYPTDANLLADGLRKILHLGGAVGVAAESGRLASGSPSPPTCQALGLGHQQGLQVEERRYGRAAAACLSAVAEIDSQGVGPVRGNCSRGKRHGLVAALRQAE